jgi:serine/threonine-protein kinase
VGAAEDDRATADHEASAATSPIEAMRREEALRVRLFAKVALGVTLSGIIIALSTGGDPVARWLVLALSVTSAAGCVAVLVLTRDPARYTARRLLVPALALAMGAMGGVYYWGTVSPITGLLVYGIYFVGLSADRLMTGLIYGAISISHGVLGVGIMAGVLADRGLIRMTGLGTRDQLAFVIIIEFLYFFAFITARLSQRVTLRAMSRLEQAVRAVAQRDVMLDEARAELDRAMVVGGPGRYTDSVLGGYKLGLLIGRGGIGEVYEARHSGDGREAAVKLLHPGALADETAARRFVREAETAARIDSPHVVRVLEVGVAPNAAPFLAMERLRGNDLAYHLRRKRRLPLATAAEVADHVARGLEAARAQAVVHRDLKPHNVFGVDAGGARVWKILDFGVSKSSDGGTLTQGSIVGTPAYMAPEQARGDSVDHRADLYSLAAILYRAVTGHLAFSARDIPTTLFEVVYRIPTQPSLLVELPADVDRVLAIGLAKSADDRFATAPELAAWFAAAIGPGLTVDERRRADRLIARNPWGARIGAPDP